MLQSMLIRQQLHQKQGVSLAALLLLLLLEHVLPRIRVGAWVAWEPILLGHWPFFRKIQGAPEDGPVI